MDWIAAFAFQSEHVCMLINQQMNSDVENVGKDREISIDQIFS